MYIDEKIKALHYIHNLLLVHFNVDERSALIVNRILRSHITTLDICIYWTRPAKVQWQIVQGEYRITKLENDDYLVDFRKPTLCVVQNAFSTTIYCATLNTRTWLGRFSDFKSTRFYVQHTDGSFRYTPTISLRNVEIDEIEFYNEAKKMVTEFIKL